MVLLFTTKCIGPLAIMFLLVRTHSVASGRNESPVSLRQNEDLLAHVTGVTLR